MFLLLIFLTCLTIHASDAHALQPRILHGDDSKRFASFAVIQWSLPIGKIMELGAGTVIHEHWILTAAHIIASFPCTGTVRAKLGWNSKWTPVEATQTVKIDVKIIHENYKHKRLASYDIGLLGTNETIQKTAFIRPARLPEKDISQPAEVYMIGHGKTKISILSSYPDSVNSALVPIIDNQWCEQYVNQELHDKKILESHVCTYTLHYSRKDNPAPLKNDGGGPLIQIKNAADEEVVGIISWIFNSIKKSQLPSVHTRVFYFVPWIKARIAANPVVTYQY